jgi:Tfp pilus assembly protein PilV
MRTDQKSDSIHTRVRSISSVRARTAERAARRRTDEGVTLIEVMVAFTVLMIALVPLSYLFINSAIQAGQSTNQQTALSIAEQWVETLSNVTPPVNGYGEVIVNKDAAPVGPAGASTTIPAAINNANASTLTTLTVPSGSTASFATASATQPQTLSVTTSSGAQTVTYTGSTTTTFTGITGWTGSTVSTAAGAAVSQTSAVVPAETKGNTTYKLLAEYEWTSVEGASNGAQPNLCTAGTPQLLKVRVTVAWGPNVDTNNVQDSVVIDYPPAGIQTLGFIALQVNGDSTALDTQQNPWSTRVQAPPVLISGSPQTLTIYPDQNGCAFAQVEPGTYTVTLSNASSGYPFSNDTYGSPPFVGNAQGSYTVTANELTQPQTYTTSATVAVGAVSRFSTYFDQGSLVSLSYPSSSATEDGVVCPGVGVLTCISSGETGTGTGVTGTAVLTVLNQSTNQWSTASLPTGVTRIASVACATTGATTKRCIGVGSGTAGAVVLSSPTSSASFMPDAIPTGIASLSQLVCPSSTQCVAIGTTTSGAAAVLSGAITATTDTWTTDAITASPTTATIAGLGNLICPVSAAGCIATATSTSPSAGSPVIVAGGYGLGWTASTPSTATFTSISSLACPSTTITTTCLVAGQTAGGPALASGTTTATGLGVAAPAWTWKADTLATGTASVAGLYCPPSTTRCLLTGRTSSAPLVQYGATTPSTSVTFAPDTTLPAAVTSLTQMACPSSTACVLIGATASGPSIVSGTIAASGADTWTSDTVPPVTAGYTLSQLSQLTCWSNPSCAITAVGTNNSNSQPVAFLLATSGTTTSWSSVGLPTGNPALYLGDIDCVGSGTATCSAVGAGATGAVELVSGSGPGGTWADDTATGLSGLTATGVPIEIDNANLAPSTFQTFITPGWTTATAPATPLPPLYPFTSGYSVYAGDCQNESITGLNVAQAATVPGGSSSATVPLGLLSVQVLHSTGASIGLPYGATLSLTSTTSGTGCGTDTYPLQSAGADGLSRTEVPYGTYNLTITTAGGTTTVTGVTVGGSSVTVGATTYLLPMPVPEKVA